MASTVLDSSLTGVVATDEPSLFNTSNFFVRVLYPFVYIVAV